MHKLLERQLKRYLGSLDAIREAWLPFINAINEAYEQGEADRALLERSLELTSQELLAKNQHLREDIEERKRTEQKLQQLVAIVASSDDAIVSQTLDGIVLSWNQGAER